MKLIVCLSVLTLLWTGCSNPNRNLVIVENDAQIDLTQLDSVRENLNGFWIPKDQLDSGYLLWLDFHKTQNTASWEMIPYLQEIERSKELPIEASPTLAELIKLDGEVHIELVSLVSLDTTKIEFLTKTKFKINGITYLRHKGYDFLKTWDVHGYKSRK